MTAIETAILLVKLRAKPRPIKKPKQFAKT